MTAPSTTLALCGTVLLLAVLGGVFALAWHGTFSGAECFGIVTTIIGIAGGIVGVHSGASAGAAATAQGATVMATPPPKP